MSRVTGTVTANQLLNSFVVDDASACPDWSIAGMGRLLPASLYHYAPAGMAKSRVDQNVLHSS